MTAAEEAGLTPALYCLAPSLREITTHAELERAEQARVDADAAAQRYGRPHEPLIT